MINNLKLMIFIKINILIYKDINLFIFTRTDHINNYYILFNFNIISFAKSFIK